MKKLLATSGLTGVLAVVLVSAGAVALEDGPFTADQAQTISDLHTPNLM